MSGNRGVDAGGASLLHPMTPEDQYPGLDDLSTAHAPI